MDTITTVNPIPLSLTDGRVPDYAVHKPRGSRLDLGCPRLIVGATGLSRVRQPTIIRVVLNKVESVNNACISRGEDVSFGPPEEVVLVDGDRLEIFTWHDNRTSFPIACGVRSDPPFSQYLLDTKTDIPAKATPGAVRIPPKQGVTASKIFATRLNNFKAVGGAAITGRVRLINQPFLRVKLWDLVRVSGAGGPDREADWGPGHPGGLKLHQQCQCYGSFRGETQVSPGDEFKIAAPGCRLYSELTGAPLDIDHQRAAFWVPLEVRLTAKAGTNPRRVTVIPDVDHEPFMDVSFNAGALLPIRRSADGRTPVPRSVSHPFSGGLIVTVVFLGGASTVARIKID